MIPDRKIEITFQLIFSRQEKTTAHMTTLQDDYDMDELLWSGKGDFLKPGVEKNGDILYLSMTQCGYDFINECINLIDEIFLKKSLPENTPN